MKDYNIHISEEYTNLGYKVIRRFKEFADLKEFGVQIAFLSSEEEKHSKGRNVCAECMKVKKEYFWCCPFDFLIIVYEPNIVGFTDKQMMILMRHELKHIGVNTNGEEPTFEIVPHDVEDFRSVLKTYGIDWNRSD